MIRAPPRDYIVRRLFWGFLFLRFPAVAVNDRRALDYYGAAGYMRVHFTAVFSTIVIVFPVRVGTHRGRRRTARRNNTTIISFPSPSLPHPSTSAGHLSLHTPDRSLIHSCSTYYYVRSRTCDDDCRVIIVGFFFGFCSRRRARSYARQRRRRFDVVFFRQKRLRRSFGRVSRRQWHGPLPSERRTIRWPSPFL